MAADILKNTLQKLYQSSERYTEKFDAYIYLLKNILLISEKIMEMGMDFLISQQELDFTQTKNILLDIVSGNVQPTFNLKNIATNFFGFLIKGLPKLNEVTLDLKQDLL